MQNDEKFSAPETGIILRVLGFPRRNFWVHKFVLSLVSLVFKHTFFFPRLTSDNLRESSVAEIETVKVTDSTDVLGITLRTKLTWRCFMRASIS